MATAIDRRLLKEARRQLGIPSPAKAAIGLVLLFVFTPVLLGVVDSRADAGLALVVTGVCFAVLAIAVLLVAVWLVRDSEVEARARNLAAGQGYLRRGRDADDDGSSFAPGESR